MLYTTYRQLRAQKGAIIIQKMFSWEPEGC